MEACTICGSTRMVPGPAYEPNSFTCMDCGSQFNRKIREFPTQEEASSQLAEEVPLPPGGFTDPMEAARHLMRLKAAAKKVNQAVDKTVDRPSKPKKPKMSIPDSGGELTLKDDFPVGLVFMAIHCYQREGESFNQTTATAKGEREFRNDNVRVFAHNHVFGKACTPTCKEI